MIPLSAVTVASPWIADSPGGDQTQGVRGGLDNPLSIGCGRRCGPLWIEEARGKFANPRLPERDLYATILTHQGLDRVGTSCHERGRRCHNKSPSKCSDASLVHPSK